jgi:hypothetical protein
MCDLKRKERVCNTNLSSSLNVKALFVSCCMTTGGKPVGQRLATSPYRVFGREVVTPALSVGQKVLEPKCESVKRLSSEIH